MVYQVVKLHQERSATKKRSHSSYFCNGTLVKCSRFNSFNIFWLINKKTSPLYVIVWYKVNLLKNITKDVTGPFFLVVPVVSSGEGQEIYFWRLILGGGKHKKASVIEQIPKGGYILSIFSKRLELTRWKTPSTVQIRVVTFLRNNASFGLHKGGLLTALGVL